MLEYSYRGKFLILLLKWRQLNYIISRSSDARHLWNCLLNKQTWPNCNVSSNKQQQQKEERGPISSLAGGLICCWQKLQRAAFRRQQINRDVLLHGENEQNSVDNMLWVSGLKGYLDALKLYEVNFSANYLNGCSATITNDSNTHPFKIELCYFCRLRIPKFNRSP